MREIEIGRCGACAESTRSSTLARMRRALLALFSTLVAGASLGAVGSASGGSTALTGSVWQVTTVAGHSPLAGSSLTSKFTPAGTVAGSAGCNSYSAGFTASGSTIRISAIASTRMACAARLMAQEAVFLRALGAARSYTVAGGKLTLKGRTGRALLSYRAQSQALPGTSWKVLSYNNGKQAVVSVSSGSKLTAVFGKDALSGFAGCNDYGATVKAAAPKISITKVNSTRKACSTPAGVMEQESAYLAALETAATYRIEGNRLELRTSTGALAAELAPG